VNERKIEGGVCPFAEHDTVMDARTSLGPLLNKPSSRCQYVYAIDLNLHFLIRIGQGFNADNLVLLQANVVNLPLESSYPTRLVCTEFLEHCRDPLAVIKGSTKYLK